CCSRAARPGPITAPAIISTGRSGCSSEWVGDNSGGSFVRALGIAFAVLTAAASISAAPAPTYALVKSVPLGAPDRWDYVVYDDQTDRVYVAHGDRLAVVDARSGDLVGEVEGIAGGTHGTAVSSTTHQGFTDDGRNGKAV